MSNPNFTALMLVIDRSGSMASIKDDMVGGLTSLLDEQKAEPGLLTVSMVTFDDAVELVHSMASPEAVGIELKPRGSTALYDALGFALNNLQSSIDALPDPVKPGNVQVIVVTDGEENASREYSGPSLKALVAEKLEKINWDIVFLGANQDAVMKAAEIGIKQGSAMTYGAGPRGVKEATDSLKRYVKDKRSRGDTFFDDDERKRASGEK
jgi:uncharacterized protein YegL